MFCEFDMKNFKLIICSILAIMVCICICGCTPSYYEDDAVKPIEDKAMQLLDEYVKSFGAESEITSLHMMIGAAEDEGIYTGYYLSNVCEGKIKAQGIDKEIKVYVFTEDGSIWSDYDQNRGEFVDTDLVVQEQMKPYFEKYGYFDDYEIDDAHICYYVLSHDVETNKKNKKNKYENTYVEFSDVIPVTQGTFDYKNMTLSGFNVYYKPQDGNYLNPNIIADYLEESENYVKKDFEAYYVNEEYTLLSSGEGSFVSYTYDTKKWVTTLTLNHDDIKDMDCDIIRFDRVTEGNMVFMYRGADKSARIYRIDEKEFQEYEPPVLQFDGNKLIFNGYDNGGVSFYFTSKPSYREIARTTYDYETGEAKDPVKMDVSEIKGGLFSITDGLMLYKDGYFMTEKQILEFIG